MGKIKKDSKLRKRVASVFAVVMLFSIALTTALFSDREQTELSLTANYPSYVVTYNANGGAFTTSDKNMVRYEDGIAIEGEYKVPTHSNPGRFFGGWFTDSICTPGREFNPVNGPASLKADINVFAKWEIVNYKIRYHSNGGTGSMPDSSHVYDTEKELTANAFARTGYTFKGWATSAGGSSVYADKAKVKNLTTTDGAVIDLYAVWEVNDYTYNIIYKSESGIQLGTDTVTNDYGTTDTIEPKEYTGYETPDDQIVKWDSTNPKTITFIYEPIEYSISYTLNGGTVATANKTKYTIETETFSLNNPTKTGYIFKGWTGSNGTTAATSVSIKKGSTGDKSFTANWTPIVYNVKYNANGGSGTMSNSTHTYDVAKALSTNAFSKTGYSFKGWATSAIGAVVYADKASVKNLSSTNEDTVNLYAVWGVKQYTYNIVYETKSGIQLGTDTITKDFGTSATVSPKSFTGYTSPVSQTVNWDSTTAKTITFVYTPIEYTISYTLNGGTVASANKTTYTIETATFTLNNPTKTGYTFKGWTGSNSTSANTSVSIVKGSTGNKSYTANWNAITYNVEYKGNNNTGGSTASSTHTYDVTKTLTANGYTKTGYTFKNWNTSANGSGTSYADKQSVTNLRNAAGTYTLYAQWTPNTYYIKYNANGGSGSMSNSTHSYDAAKTLNANTFTKTGYSFKGWATSAGGSVVYTDKQSVSNLTSVNGNTINLYAVWEVNPYTYNIIYKSTSGIQLGTGTITKNYGTTNTVDPKSFTGYTSPASQSIAWDSTTAKTITFVYTPIEYTLSYTLNGGTVATANKTKYTIETATFMLNNPTKTGYTFKGWTGSNGSTASTSVSIAKGSTGNKSYTANWTPNTYYVKYNANGGSGSMSNSTHTYGTAKALTTNAFTKTGYTFKGWATSASGSVAYTDKQSVSNLTANNGATVNLYAVWEVNPYTYNIVYKSTSGVQLGTGTVTKNYGTTNTVSPKSFTGYTSPASQSIAWDSITAKIITFVYTPIEYTISYTLNSGTVSTANPTKYTIETATFTLNNPTRTGYTFKGWTGSNGTTASTSVSVTKGSTGNKSYTANWTPITYYVKYNANGGSGTMSNSTHTYGTASNLTANAFTKSGYAFAGWATSTSGAVVYADQASVKNLSSSSGAVINLYAKWEQPLPILKKWSSSDTTDFHSSTYKSKITSMEFVNSASVPSTKAAGPWDVSAEGNNSVQAWLTTTDNGATYKLTIAGNGYGKIFANEVSSWAFYKFTGLKAITGANIVETGGLKNSDGTWKVKPVRSMNSMFSGCTALESISNISNWNVASVENMGATFADCKSLKSLNLANWNVGANEDFNSTFSGCESLTTIGSTTNWNTSNVDDMRAMFEECESLQSVDVTNWKVDNVTDMYCMFDTCESLTTIGSTTNWKTGNVKNMARMFYSCELLTSVDTSKWDTAKVTNMTSMFSQCKALTKLDVGKWDTGAVTNMSSMFYRCSGLTALDVAPKNVTKSDGTTYSAWNVSKVTTFRQMFCSCKALASLDVSGWVTSSNTSLIETFSDCQSLTTLNLSGWDVSKVTSTKGMFNECVKLTTVGNLGNWKTSLMTATDNMFNDCHKLTSINISTWDMSANTNNEQMFWYCESLTELTIPASLTHLDEAFAAMCQKLSTVTFKHAANATITFPTAGYVDNNTTLGGYLESDDYGAFYAGSPYTSSNLLSTTVKSSNASVRAYKWSTDNRKIIATAALDDISEISEINVVENEPVAMFSIKPDSQMNETGENDIQEADTETEIAEDNNTQPNLDNIEEIPDDKDNTQEPAVNDIVADKEELEDVVTAEDNSDASIDSDEQTKVDSLSEADKIEDIESETSFDDTNEDLTGDTLTEEPLDLLEIRA